MTETWNWQSDRNLLLTELQTSDGLAEMFLDPNLRFWSAWCERADTLAAFLASSGRMPSKESEEYQEQTLGNWLSDQRRAERNNDRGWSEQRREYLDRVAPGWRGEDREEAWQEAAGNVGAFVATHGRMPRSESDNPRERKAGQWLAYTRKAEKDRDNGWSEQRREYLDRVVPGWRGVDREGVWREAADRVGAFVATHGRMPSKHHTDPAERGIGHWIVKQRMSEQDREYGWSEQRREYLDRVVPGWRGVDREGVWREAADRVGAFVTTHGRMPSQKSKTLEESRCGKWLVRQRMSEQGREYGWSEQRREYLDRVIPEWRGVDPEESWRALVASVGAFVATHGRLPKEKSKDPAERRLGQWLGYTRKAEKSSNKSWSEARREYIDRFVPGWRG